MQLPTKTKTGLKALIYIAMQNEKYRCSIKEISEELNISNRYLEQIFRYFKKSNILEGSKGPNGGYKLLKKANKISLYEIISLLQPELVKKDIFENKDKYETSINITLSKPLDDLIIRFLKKISLQDLIDNFNLEENYMYYI
ncbi:BadM/Rrf2 family transcriptional regulator [Hypnocyclicus thermotrophus]|uniref:BadM/Rrf2 family transcriptional regulator n=1 Tax=Hypnocyclicus thermotrophus TaxID=1627895 RepID=A0AA46DZF4_9FUSO|nr:Rrf2 family transcriptional regulator [Hypnocyclicus thermotrophus]TDT71584.1 BadM/Rrf2 family transcriptional regulator [Hypnocyclicus thermotrophus]